MTDDCILSLSFPPRLHNHPASTYETGSTKKFEYGRTETVRSCSSEALEFSKGMDSKTCGRQVKIELLMRAVQGHSRLTKEVGFPDHSHVSEVSL
jgi:hypothetical protein